MVTAALSAVSVLVAFSIVPSTWLSAQETDSAQLVYQRLEASFKYQQGKISLKGGLATLDVPQSFRYLNPEQSAKLLEAWGNPPNQETLGMLFPSDLSPFSRDGWGVVITFEEDGYVKDDDAEKINYDDLLKQMQEAEKEGNDERKKAGYDPIHIVGWAARPQVRPNGAQVVLGEGAAIRQQH